MPSMVLLTCDRSVLHMRQIFNLQKWGDRRGMPRQSEDLSLLAQVAQSCMRQQCC